METNVDYRPEGSIPLAAKIRFCRINLAWSKLRRSQHAARENRDENSPSRHGHSLDTFSPHDIQDLLGSALIQTAPRIPSHDIGRLDVEVPRRQSSIGLLDEGGNRSIIIRKRKERPQAVWNWKLSAIVKGNCWWSKVPVSTHARLIR